MKRTRLCGAGLASSRALLAKLDYGNYQLQDDAFAEWLRNLELDT
jgi:hypothetical protein